jgi:hypothetical protein
LSNGQLLTATDRDANARADHLAKQAARETRAPIDTCRALDDLAQRAYALAKWVGIVTQRANDMPEPPHRYSTQPDQQTRAARKRQRQSKRASRPPSPPRPLALGGHDIQRSPGVSHCMICRRQSRHHIRFAAQACSGSAAFRWADLAARSTADLTAGGGACQVLNRRCRLVRPM